MDPAHGVVHPQIVGEGGRPRPQRQPNARSAGGTASPPQLTPHAAAPGDGAPSTASGR